MGVQLCYFKFCPHFIENEVILFGLRKYFNFSIGKCILMLGF